MMRCSLTKLLGAARKLPSDMPTHRVDTEDGIKNRKGAMLTPRPQEAQKRDRRRSKEAEGNAAIKDGKLEASRVLKRLILYFNFFEIRSPIFRIFVISLPPD